MKGRVTSCAHLLAASLLLLVGCASGVPLFEDEPDITVGPPDGTSPEDADEDVTEACLQGLWRLDNAAWAEEIAIIFNTQAQLDAEVSVTGSALLELRSGAFGMEITQLISDVNVDLDGLPMQTRFIITGEEAGGWEVSDGRMRMFADGGSIETILLTTVGGIPIDEPEPVPYPRPWAEEMTVICGVDTLELGISTGATTVFVTYSRVED